MFKTREKISKENVLKNLNLVNVFEENKKRLMEQFLEYQKYRFDYFYNELTFNSDEYKADFPYMESFYKKVKSLSFEFYNLENMKLIKEMEEILFSTHPDKLFWNITYNDTLSQSYENNSIICSDYSLRYFNKFKNALFGMKELLYWMKNKSVLDKKFEDLIINILFLLSNFPYGDKIAKHFLVNYKHHIDYENQVYNCEGTFLKLHDDVSITFINLEMEQFDNDSIDLKEFTNPYHYTLENIYEVALKINSHKIKENYLPLKLSLINNGWDLDDLNLENILAPIDSEIKKNQKISKEFEINNNFKKRESLKDF